MNMSDFDNLGYTELLLIIGACLMIFAEMYGAKILLFLLMYIVGSIFLGYFYYKIINRS